MNLIDLSHPLDSTNISIYPGDPLYACRVHASIEKDGYAVHSISLGTHTGTHIDAPSHFFASGQTIDQIPLSSLVGPALVVDLTHKRPREPITWEADLAAHAPSMHNGVILLLRTGWSRYWGTEQYLNHPFVTRDAAEKITATGVKVLGVDTLSPDETGGGKEDFGVHEVVLSAGCVIAENLTNLAAIPVGGESDSQWFVSMMPLNFLGCDGSPVRAYAFDTERMAERQ